MNRQSLTLTSMVLSLATATLLFASPAAAATACEAMTGLSLPHGTVDAAEVVAAGGFTPPGGAGNAAQDYARLPAFCRLMLTSRPTDDSDIKIEVWLPASGWNGSFQAIGQGGMAGSIPYRAMVPALVAGYATAGTDTGHVGNNANFMPQYPEKLVDFAYRACRAPVCRHVTIHTIPARLCIDVATSSSPASGALGHGLYIYGLDIYDLCIYGLYLYGLYIYGLCIYGLYIYGLYIYGLYSYGLYSCGLYGPVLDSYGPHRLVHGLYDMAYIMAYIITT